MSTTEMDAAERLARLTSKAESIFGDAAFARKWMSLPNPVMENRVPCELAETEAGAREVEAALLHFAYGDYL